MPRIIITPVFQPNGRVLDPDRTIILCEAPGCTEAITIGQSHSLLVCYATTGPDVGGAGRGVPSFGCPEEQHFCCSAEHAMQAAFVCMREHLLPLHARLHAEIAQLAGQPLLPGAVASASEADAGGGTP